MIPMENHIIYQTIYLKMEVGTHVNTSRRIIYYKIKVVVDVQLVWALIQF